VQEHRTQEPPVLPLASDVVLGDRPHAGQDGLILESASGNLETEAGEMNLGVTVGNKAILHGCTVGDGCLIGMGATILNHAVIGAGSIVGAGALVTEKKEFPPNSLIVGSPARVVRTLGPDVATMLQGSADLYAAKAAHYANDLRPL